MVALPGQPDERTPGTDVATDPEAASFSDPLSLRERVAAQRPGEGSPPPTGLSLADESRLQALLSKPQSPIDLARQLGLPLHELLAWAAEPRIQQAIDTYEALEAIHQKRSDRQRLETALATLEAIQKTSDDLVEKRRAAALSIRALKARPTMTTRAAAGASPPAAPTRSGSSDPSSPPPRSPRRPRFMTPEEEAIYQQQQEERSARLALYEYNRNPPKQVLDLLAKPDPALTARETLDKQLAALDNNHEPFKGAGIYTVKNFWDPDLPESRLCKFDFEHFFSDSSRGHSLWFQYRDIGEPTLTSDEHADHAHFEVTTHSLPPDKYAHYSTDHFSIHLKRKRAQSNDPPHPWHTHSIQRLGP